MNLQRSLTIVEKSPLKMSEKPVMKIKTYTKELKPFIKKETLTNDTEMKQSTKI